MPEILSQSSYTQDNELTRPEECVNYDWLSDFDVKETIGLGTFSEVKLGVRRSTGQKFALKIMSHEKIIELGAFDKFQSELDIHLKLRHPNIVRLYEAITCPKDKYTCLVTELVDGQDMLDYVTDQPEGKLDLGESLRLFLQIANAVQYLHTNGIVHRDLKLENIMVDWEGKKAKLIDFGLACPWAPGKLLREFCGTPLYAAPEIHLQQEYAGPKADVWSLGVVLYCMVTGGVPWPGCTDPEALNNAVQGIWIPAEVPSQLNEIFRESFQVEMKERIGIMDIVENEWMLKNSTKKSRASGIYNTITHDL